MTLKLHIYFGDTFEILKAKQDKWKHKFRTVFADPPYFVSGGKGVLARPEGVFKRKGVRLNKGNWDEETNDAKIIDFNRKWLKLTRPLIAKDGTIWICGFLNFNLWAVRMAMLPLGYRHLNNIVIVKPNAVPNLKGVRFAAATEEMIWAKVYDKYYFAYHRMKKYNGAPDSPRGKQMHNYWIIPVDTRMNVGLHATQKNYEQVRRAILATTDEGDWVLDPFGGTCTTMKICKELHRNCICIEKGFYYENQDTHLYQCTCDKGFKTLPELIAHHNKTGHKRQFVKDIMQKVGWNDQALDGKIEYKMFTKYFKE